MELHVPRVLQIVGLLVLLAGACVVAESAEEYACPCEDAEGGSSLSQGDALSDSSLDASDKEMVDDVDDIAEADNDIQQHQASIQAFDDSHETADQTDPMEALTKMETRADLQTDALMNTAAAGDPPIMLALKDRVREVRMQQRLQQRGLGDTSGSDSSQSLPSRASADAQADDGSDKRNRKKCKCKQKNSLHGRMHLQTLTRIDIMGLPKGLLAPHFDIPGGPSKEAFRRVEKIKTMLKALNTALDMEHQAHEELHGEQLDNLKKVQKETQKRVDIEKLHRALLVQEIKDKIAHAREDAAKEQEKIKLRLAKDQHKMAVSDSQHAAAKAPAVKHPDASKVTNHL